MSYSIVSRDTLALVNAILPDVKAHLNVTFVDDDAIIRRYINWAIGYLEADSELNFAPMQIEWRPDAAEVTVLPFPVQPIVATSMVVTNNDTGLDVSAEYLATVPKSLTERSLFSRADRAAIGPVVISYSSGYVDPVSLPQIAEAYIFRVAATLYENRESITSLNLDQIPSWMNDRLAGLWVPRA